MRLGCLGDIVFEVSERHINAMSELKRERRWSYAEHEIIKGKARLQMLGRQLDTVTIAGRFVHWFCKPLLEIKRLEEEAEKKEPLVLVMSDETLGEFVIESITETWKEVDNEGNPRVIEFEMTLREYY